jgi:hypothetical protein
MRLRDLLTLLLDQVKRRRRRKRGRGVREQNKAAQVSTAGANSSSQRDYDDAQDTNLGGEEHNERKDKERKYKKEKSKKGKDKKKRTKKAKMGMDGCSHEDDYNDNGLYLKEESIDSYLPGLASDVPPWYVNHTIVCLIS